jgi:DNA-binding transcriptional LysR family regulator
MALAGELHFGRTAERLGLTHRGQLDLLIMRTPVNNPDLVVGPVLTTEERVVLVAADHPLAARARPPAFHHCNALAARER